jgi:hypothetical protein
MASVYAKANERTRLELLIDDGSSTVETTTVNLTTGASSNPDATVTEGEDDWWRISLPFVHSGTTTRMWVLLDNGATTTYVGVVGNGLYLWGAQINRGSVVTPLVVAGDGGATTDNMANGDDAFLYIYDMPGDVGAPTQIELTDLSSSDVINRFRLARRSSRQHGWESFAPWINAAIAGVGTSTVDATAFGGAYTTATTTLATEALICRATLDTARRDDCCWRRLAGLLRLTTRERASHCGRHHQLDVRHW